MSTYWENVSPAFNSTDFVLQHIKLSFILGLGISLLTLPFCKSHKSFCDAIAARKVLKVLRYLVGFEILLIGVLFALYFTRGNPLYLHALLPYGNGDSWLYGYGRPSGGLVFIGLGLFSHMHPIIRLLCIFASGFEVFCDSLSAYQVHEYFKQVKYNSAPSNGYSLNALEAYYWRDIISIGVCVSIFIYCCYLCIQIGWWSPQLIHPSYLSGNEYDRVLSMNKSRRNRKRMEDRKLIETPPSLIKKNPIKDIKNKDFETLENKPDADQDNNQVTDQDIERQTNNDPNNEPVF